MTTCHCAKSYYNNIDLFWKPVSKIIKCPEGPEVVNTGTRLTSGFLATAPPGKGKRKEFRPGDAGTPGTLEPWRLQERDGEGQRGNGLPATSLDKPITPHPTPPPPNPSPTTHGLASRVPTSQGASKICNWQFTLKMSQTGQHESVSGIEWWVTEASHTRISIGWRRSKAINHQSVLRQVSTRDVIYNVMTRLTLLSDIFESG